MVSRALTLWMELLSTAWLVGVGSRQHVLVGEARLSPLPGLGWALVTIQSFTSHHWRLRTTCVAGSPPQALARD